MSELVLLSGGPFDGGWIEVPTGAVAAWPARHTCGYYDTGDTVQGARVFQHEHDKKPEKDGHPKNVG